MPDFYSWRPGFLRRKFDFESEFCFGVIASAFSCLLAVRLDLKSAADASASLTLKFGAKVLGVDASAFLKRI